MRIFLKLDEHAHTFPSTPDASLDNQDPCVECERQQKGLLYSFSERGRPRIVGLLEFLWQDTRRGGGDYNQAANVVRDEEEDDDDATASFHISSPAPPQHIVAD